MKRTRTYWPSSNGNGAKPTLSPSHSDTILNPELSPPEYETKPRDNGKHPGGRPPKYHESHPHRAFKLISRNGIPQEDLAVAFGVTDACISQWKDEHPEFLKAINDAWYAWTTGEVKKALARRAVGFTVPEEKVFCNGEGLVTKVQTKRYYPPDTSALMYWLNNRAKDEWAYATRVEHSGKVQTEEVGEASKAIAQFIKGASQDKLLQFRDSIKNLTEGANGECRC